MFSSRLVADQNQFPNSVLNTIFSFIKGSERLRYFQRRVWRPRFASLLFATDYLFKYIILSKTNALYGNMGILCWLPDIGYSIFDVPSAKYQTSKIQYLSIFNKQVSLLFAFFFVLAPRFASAQWTTKLLWRFGRSRALAMTVLFLAIGFGSSAQWMLINRDGGNPDSSAALEIQDTSRGFLPPRLSNAQMQNIGNSAATGLMVYNTDSSSYYYYNGSNWVSFGTIPAPKYAVPTGAILPFGGDTSQIPTGFILCNGQLLDTTSYSELYAAIGSAWGATGSNFNVPDLRGRFIRGTALGNGRDPDRNSRGQNASGGNNGDRVGSTQSDQFKSHKHNNNNISARGFPDGSGDRTSNYYLMHASKGTDYDIGMSSVGGTETRPENAYVNYIICYKSSVAAAGTNSSVFQGSVAASQLPLEAFEDSSRITEADGTAKVKVDGLDNIVFTTGSSERMRINSSGNVGIGTTSPTYKLHVNGSVAGTSAYTNLSDSIYKTRIEPITLGLEKIMALNPIKYDWKREEFPEKNFEKGKGMGFIAQEVEHVIPEMVQKDKEGIYSLQYSELIPVLVKAIQEQQEEIEELKEKLYLLELGISLHNSKAELK